MRAWVRAATAAGLAATSAAAPVAALQNLTCNPCGVVLVLSLSGVADPQATGSGGVAADVAWQAWEPDAA